MPTLVLLLASSALLAASPAGTTVAVTTPVALDGAPAWVGRAMADELAVALMDHSRPGPDGKPEYPLNVYTWRETAAAARGAGVDPARPLGRAGVERLAADLGARWVFVATYALKKPRTLVLGWRLVDTESPRAPRAWTVRTNVPTLSRNIGKLVVSVLRGLGEKPGKPGNSRRPWPMKAVVAYGQGLDILAGQSLEPYARVVLPRPALERAAALFEQAAAAAPRFARARLGLALSRAMLGDAKRAQDEVMRALTQSDGLEALDSLGPYYLYVRQDRTADAIKVLMDATNRRPGFLLGMGYLGSAFLRAGKAQEAALTFGVYEARVPRSPWAKLMHARALAFAGDHEAALAETRAVYDASPQSLVAITNMGARLGQAGKLTEAVDVLERGLALHADSPVLLTRLAWVQLQLGHPELGLELAQRAVAKVGDGRGETLAGYAYADLGHAYALLGRKPEARAAFDKAAALGIDVEARLLLLADEKAKQVLVEQKSPILADQPPPLPESPPALSPAAQAAAEALAATPTSPDGPSWDEGEGESWTEEEEASAAAAEWERTSKPKP